MTAPSRGKSRRAVFSQRPADAERQLAAEIHQYFSHGLALAERLAFLDDEYDWRKYAERTRGQIDMEVMDTARTLSDHWRRPSAADE